jgi:Nif-specific regulatory protein
LRLSDDAVAALMEHDWPGNVRKLENSIERAAIVADQDVVARDDLALTAATVLT